MSNIWTWKTSGRNSFQQDEQHSIEIMYPGDKTKELDPLTYNTLNEGIHTQTYNL